jgi:hypothetical protein
VVWSSDWSVVEQLPAGALVHVRFKGSIDRRAGYVIHADDAFISLLTFEAVSVSENLQKIVLDIATNHPSFLSNPTPRASFASGDVRLAADGIFVGQQRIAELADVTIRVPKDQVAEISGLVRTRGSLVGLTVGIAVGFGAGFLLAHALRGCECPPLGFWVATSAGAGGVGGLFTGGRTVERVVYRAA